MENFDCCTSLEPCENGEGDCDNDEECVGNLKCSDGTGMDHWNNLNRGISKSLYKIYISRSLISGAVP